MNTGELEDLTLLLVRDGSEPEMWIDRWAVSYPVVQTVECTATQSICRQQECVAAAFAHVRSDHVMAVAHGAGAAAFVAWYATVGMPMQKRIKGIILAAPLQSACRSGTVRFTRLMCPKTAVVVGSGDELCPQQWAAEQAALWGGRLLVSPHQGHLNGRLGGWQWGMKLMQEMLLA